MSKCSQSMARADQQRQQNDRFYSCIRKEEVSDTLRKMKTKNVIYPDRIPVEI